MVIAPSTTPSSATPPPAPTPCGTASSATASSAKASSTTALGAGAAADPPCRDLSVDPRDGRHDPSSQDRTANDLTAEELSAEELSAEQLLAWRRRLMAESGWSADFDWLLDLAGGLAWSDLQALRLHPARRITLQQPRQAIADLWRRHLATAEPLQYLVGVCPWRDLELLVAPGVLIPRQGSELLVELALGLAPNLPPADPLLWADLGTGSGCLAIALARGLPGSKGFAVDASPEALRIAALNLARSGLQERVALVEGNWWEGLRSCWGRLSLVVANPPYIPTATLAALDPVVRDHEPRLALDGGADGLASIRQVVTGAARALAPGGLLLLEHHHDHSPAVAALLAEAGLEDGAAHRDLEGIVRFAAACRPALASPR